MEEVTISPIIDLPSRQPKLQNNYTKEILILLRNFKDPQLDFPIWGSSKGTKNPREFDFLGQWDLITEFPQDWGNRFLEHTENIVCTRTQNKGE